MGARAQTPASLIGRRVVVTQAAHQAHELCDLLRARGAEPLAYPCIAIMPPEDMAVLDSALRNAATGGYDWLIITSANTVMVLAGRLQALGLSGAMSGALSIAAIGSSTAEAVQTQLAVPVSLVPGDQTAEGLAAALGQVLSPGERVLLPQADIARPVLQRQLAATGAKVMAVAAYRTALGAGGVDLPRLLATKQVDAVTFTSASTVRNLLLRLHNEGGERSHLDCLVIACIGPITADAAQELGLNVAVVAEEQSLEGLVETLATYWNNSR